MEMESLYTETLSELLKNKGYGTDKQNQSLTDCISVMEKFPDFVFGEDIQISMLTLFMDKYDIREIGSETEELFLHYWKETAQKLLIDYAPKIQMWLDNFNNLFKFTVELKYAENLGYSTDATNTYYLNPVNTISPNTEPNLKPQNVGKDSEAGRRNRSYTKDVLQSVWGKTRAQLLEQIFDLKNLYTDCLEEFESIFMGVL